MAALTDDRLRRLIRVARRVPGYGRVRRRAITGLRSSPTARRFVKRVFAAEPARSKPVDVTPGHVLGGLGAEQLPVVLVLLLGLPEARVAAVVEEVAQLQVLGAAFRPVFVLDAPTFGPIRPYGYPVELLIPRADWGEQETSWETYLRRRLAAVMASFATSATITVTAAGLTEIDRALLAGPA